MLLEVLVAFFCSPLISRRGEGEQISSSELLDLDTAKADLGLALPALQGDVAPGVTPLVIAEINHDGAIER